MSDAGLHPFEDCRNLRYLSLQDNPQVGDAALDHVKEHKSLEHLILKNTKVTAPKIEELKKALPQCKIVWGGGTIDPKTYANPERRATEWARRVGGTVSILVGGEWNEVKALAELPRLPFSVGYLNLSNCLVADADLTLLKGLKDI